MSREPQHPQVVVLLRRSLVLSCSFFTKLYPPQQRATCITCVFKSIFLALYILHVPVFKYDFVEQANAPLRQLYQILSSVISDYRHRILTFVKLFWRDDDRLWLPKSCRDKLFVVTIVLKFGESEGCSLSDQFTSKLQPIDNHADGW
jgi:hypothetical protein